MRPADVVVIARGLITEYKKTYGVINAPINVLENGLLAVVEHQTQVKVSVNCLPWPGNMFYARLNRYKEKAQIWYSTDLNVCWSRLVICKEAFHLLSGEDKNYSADPVSLVNGLINEIPPGIDHEVDAEWMAIYGAMEMLIPGEMDKALYEMETAGKTHYEIAYFFRVPEKIISLRLSPSVRLMMDQLHNEMR